MNLNNGIGGFDKGLFMRVLVTGSDGFVGKNLIVQLEKERNVEEIMQYDLQNSFDDLKKYCAIADAIFHLAAIVRPDNPDQWSGNINLTTRLLEYQQNAGNKSPIMFASSIQAELDNPYGRCKRAEESAIIKYGKNNGVNTFVFRFPNLFGTMSRPNYTSVVATFCYNTIKGLPITISDPANEVQFAFVESVLERVVKEVIANRYDNANRIIEVQDCYPVRLGELAYYMQVMKTRTESGIARQDDFFSKLEYTYRWFEGSTDQNDE